MTQQQLISVGGMSTTPAIAESPPGTVPDVTGATAPLVRYDAACRALAQAKAVDEVKQIRDTAEAMRAYAKQVKNKDLEIDAAEIRMRAEIRIGELAIEQERTVGLNRGA